MGEYKAPFVVVEIETSKFHLSKLGVQPHPQMTCEELQLLHHRLHPHKQGLQRMPVATVRPDHR